MPSWCVATAIAPSMLSVQDFPTGGDGRVVGVARKALAARRHAVVFDGGAWERLGAEQKRREHGRQVVEVDKRVAHPCDAQFRGWRLREHHSDWENCCALQMYLETSER